MKTLMLRLACFFTLLLVPLVHAAEAKRPNILWLTSEDNHTFLGCYGDPVARTPTLDKLAKEGILYERCFSQPVCAPSRFALITGSFAVSSGPAGHMRASGKIPQAMKGFPALLREAGYYTTNNAKTDYNSPINMKETWNESGNQAHWRKAQKNAQPFFSVFNHEVTHESCLFPVQDRNLAAPPMDRALVRIPPYQPDTPEIRDDWGRYHDHIHAMDGMIAQKLAELEKAGLAEDTIVFYFADNGGVLPRSKRFLQQSGSNVPLIVYFPPKWRHLAPATPGTRIKDPVCFPDFGPTVLSLAGVKPTSVMQGKAFAGESRAAPNQFVFSTRDRMDERYDMMRSVADKRWLYIRNFRPDLPYVQPLNYMFQARGYQSWAKLAEQGKLADATSMFWGSKPSEELYDMESDPDNVKNLAYDPAHRPTVERMRAALKRHTLDIVDNGFMPEGSAQEGYDASRQPGAYPLERIFDLAMIASSRDAQKLPDLVKALDDENESVRWWAAQGCTVLGNKAADAEKALRARLNDDSLAVQVAAAEALAKQGHADAALPVLERVLTQNAAPFAALQAANVLDRIGEQARPLLPVLQQRLKALPSGKGANSASAYQQRILERIIAVLQGREKALVYPAKEFSPSL
jgi:arylsulfatase A-like enzyme